MVHHLRRTGVVPPPRPPGLVLLRAHGGGHHRPPRAARTDGGPLRRQGGRRGAQHGVRDELHGAAGPRGARRSAAERPAEPHEHRRGGAGERGDHPDVPAQRCGTSRTAAARRRAGGTGRRGQEKSGAVAENFCDYRGHLQHGGRNLRPGRDRARLSKIRGLHLSGRGALHRCARPDRTGVLRVLRRGSGGHRRDDGHLHQELRGDGGVRGGR
mmetsp:Transcript_26651/g.53117  ORF Transcript_26651/g.53117 Transcript_26651/m.53117 type:complete len:213 (+) Transcript_26651:833-1471(+)